MEFTVRLPRLIIYNVRLTTKKLYLKVKMIFSANHICFKMTKSDTVHYRKFNSSRFIKNKLFCDDHLIVRLIRTT